MQTAPVPTPEPRPSNVVLDILRPIGFLAIIFAYWPVSTLPPWLAPAVAVIGLATNVFILWIPCRSDAQWYRRLWVEWGAIVLFSAWAGMAEPFGPHPMLFGISVFTAYLGADMARAHRLLIATILAWVLFSAIAPWQAWAQMASHLGLYGPPFAFFALVGYLAGRGHLRDVAQRRLLAELEASQLELQDANARLQAHAEQAAELAALAERNRLSRDIHDTVGHALTALLVQLQAGRRLSEQGGASEPVTARLTQAEGLARGALQEVRLAVQALRLGGTGQAGQRESLARLTGGFAASTGLTVTVTPDWPQTALPTGVMEAVYRSIQEALTNAFRHGQARQVTIDFSGSTPRMLHLTIRDDGHGCDCVIPGVGLRGLAERCEELGGTLTTGAGADALSPGTPGRGFALRLRLPLTPGEEESA